MSNISRGVFDWLKLKTFSAHTQNKTIDTGNNNSVVFLILMFNQTLLYAITTWSWRRVENSTNKIKPTVDTTDPISNNSWIRPDFGESLTVNGSAEFWIKEMSFSATLSVIVLEIVCASSTSPVILSTPLQNICTSIILESFLSDWSSLFFYTLQLLSGPGAPLYMKALQSSGHFLYSEPDRRKSCRNPALLYSW